MASKHVGKRLYKIILDRGLEAHYTYKVKKYINLNFHMNFYDYSRVFWEQISEYFLTGGEKETEFESPGLSTTRHLLERFCNVKLLL